MQQIVRPDCMASAPRCETNCRRHIQLGSRSREGVATTRMSQELKSDSGVASRLLSSGVIFAAISFVTGLGHLAFQGIMGHHLKGVGEFGSANSALGGLMTLLGLLPAAATFAVTHYIAHFNTCGDDARLQGLLRGCRRFLFRLTIAGSVLAIIRSEEHTSE